MGDVLDERNEIACDRRDPCAYDNTCKSHKAYARLRADVERLTRERDEALARLGKAHQTLEEVETENDALRAVLGQLVGALRKLLYVALPTDVSGERWVKEARAALAAAVPYLP